jgi:hypothetical protein
MSDRSPGKLAPEAEFTRVSFIAALVLLAAGCSSSAGPGKTPAAGGTTGSGSGGTSSSAGGSGGSSSAGGSGGSSSAGGSGGSSSAGGSGGGGGAAPGNDASAGSGGTPGNDASSPTTDSGASSGEKHPIKTGNKLVGCNAPGHHLDGAPATDFCDFYEAYCHYDPTGMELNQGKTPAQRADAKSNAPWFYKDYNDCLTRYMMATPTSQSCRAGQLCSTDFKAGQGCTHASGHFADCP